MNAYFHRNFLTRVYHNVTQKNATITPSWDPKRLNCENVRSYYCNNNGEGSVCFGLYYQQDRSKSNGTCPNWPVTKLSPKWSQGDHFLTTSMCLPQRSLECLGIGGWFEGQGSIPLDQIFIFLQCCLRILLYILMLESRIDHSVIHLWNKNKYIRLNSYFLMILKLC